MTRATRFASLLPRGLEARSGRGRRFRCCLSRRVHRHAPRQLHRPRPPRPPLDPMQRGPRPPSGATGKAAIAAPRVDECRAFPGDYARLRGLAPRGPAVRFEAARQPGERRSPAYGGSRRLSCAPALDTGPSLMARRCRAVVSRQPARLNASLRERRFGSSWPSRASAPPSAPCRPLRRLRRLALRDPAGSWGLRRRRSSRGRFTEFTCHGMAIFAPACAPETRAARAGWRARPTNRR